MQVLYDHFIFQTQQWGGISRYFQELVQGINRLSPEVKIYLFQGFHVNNYHIDAQLERTFACKIPYIPKTGRLRNALNGLFFQIFLASIPRERLVYHTTYYHARFGRYGKGCKRVVTVYDMIHELFPKMAGRDVPIVTELKKKSVAWADAVIAISWNTRRDLVKIFGVSEEKIKVIYPGVNFDKFSRRVFGDGNLFQKPFVLYVGNRNGYKNFDLLLRAFALWKYRRDFCLVCIGGERDFSDAQKNIMHEHQIEDRVFLKQAASDRELTWYFQNATFFVFPSLYEGFGFPPLEAMAAGIPVIASNASSVPEVVGDAALLFDPYSLDDLLMKMSLVIENRELAGELVTKGNLRVLQFSWERTCQETLALYRDLIDE